MKRSVCFLLSVLMIVGMAGSCSSEKESTHAHSYGEGVITKAASCTEEGVKTFTCSGCKETYTEIIPKTAHIPTVDQAVSPTCTEEGLTEGSHCAICNEILVAQEKIEASGHLFSDEWTVDTQATCTSSGKKSHHCMHCDAVIDETIIEEGHDYKESSIEKKATYYEDGVKSYECQKCHEIKKETYSIFKPLTKNDVSEKQWGNWSVTDNSILGDNTTLGDAFSVLNLYAKEGEEVVVDFTVNGLAYDIANDYGGNFAYGVKNQEDPGAAWGGVSVNFGQNNARMFGYCTPNTNDKSLINLNNQESYHVRFEITAQKWISYYINDRLVSTFYNDEYKGGYLAFCTWKGKIAWTNIKYYIGNELNLTRGMYLHEKEADHLSVFTNSWGNWTKSTDEMSIEAANLNDGDFFSVSDRFLSAETNFTYEAYINTYEGGAAGLVFGMKTPSDPGSCWICYNVSPNDGNTRLFVAGGNNTTTFDVYPSKNYEFARGFHHVKIVGEGNSQEKTFKFYADGVLIGTSISKNYQGGYLGLMTFFANATFYNVTCTIN